MMMDNRRSADPTEFTQATSKSQSLLISLSINQSIRTI